MRSIFHFRHIFVVPVSQQELDKILFRFCLPCYRMSSGAIFEKHRVIDLSPNAGGTTKEHNKHGGGVISRNIY